MQSLTKPYKFHFTASSMIVMVLAAMVMMGLLLPPTAPAAAVCDGKVKAEVVALDQPYMQNRLGAFNANGMIYALKRDVIDKGTLKPCLLPDGTANPLCTPGNVMLRPDKRPRPIVLRMNAGNCIDITFTNLLDPIPVVTQCQNAIGVLGQPTLPQILPCDDQPRTRQAGIHANGMQLVNSILDDGSNVGRNSAALPGPAGLNGLVAPGQTITYSLYADFENIYMLNSMANTVGNEGGGGQQTFGLFGSVNVEPVASEWYRANLLHEEMALATVSTTADGHPVLNYDAVYPAKPPFIAEGKAGLPIIKLYRTVGGVRELVHTDIHAVITGPNRGPLTGGPEVGTLYSQFASPSNGMGEDPVTGDPIFNNRTAAFRETTSIFHDETAVAEAFPEFYKDPVLVHVYSPIRDGFAINYGTGGIGSEILSNVLRVGPSWDCPECKAEEFFLSSWSLGDPAMVVDIPANGGPANVDRTPGPKAHFALYADDPSNVNHNYINDAAKIRNIHVGPKEHHIFHLHGIQWDFSPLADRGNYIDFQEIGPGTGYTYDMMFGGAGNRNKHMGDYIYHCHFYPHFAMGMWALWRAHDVFEEGTVLAKECTVAKILAGTCNRAPFALFDGTPAIGARAVPDGELQMVGGVCTGMCFGAPIPAIVPIPGHAMAPMPAKVSINPADPRAILVVPNPITGEKNPGFPFMAAAANGKPGAFGGHRGPSPVLDMDPAHGGFDGGLPRHVIAGCGAGPCLPGVNYERAATRVDLNKELLNVQGFEVPEFGTAVEKDAMAYHEVRKHATYIQPTNGGAALKGKYVMNGQPRTAGAPFADPCLDDAGNRIKKGVTPFFVGQTALSPKVVQFDADHWRQYANANIQIDTVINKAGWHFNQERIIALWEDVMPTFRGQRPPEPLVFRGNALDCLELKHTNLLPNFYEMDDYQVRTATDIVSQHIHMVKFDITSSDGAANGWNYEDGTMSADEVRERIVAINAGGGLITTAGRRIVEAQPHPFFGQFPEGQCPNGRWCGARVSIQRWFVDPLLGNDGTDNGMRNVFTHDHFGPSSHQQLGFYSTFLVEPNASTWLMNESNNQLGVRPLDGGPTSWQARIITPDTKSSFREFYFEWSDFQEAYRADWNGVVDANSFRFAIAPSVKEVPVTATRQDPGNIFEFSPICPGGVVRPCPEGIAAADPGTMVVNYRNEPVALRVFDPKIDNGDGTFGGQTAGIAGDLSYAFSSDPAIVRAIPALNQLGKNCVRDTPPPPLSPPGNIDPNAPVVNFDIGPALPCPQLTNDVGKNDPFTPIMRTYSGDLVKVRVQVGATEESHNVNIHGLKWLQEQANPLSGWRNVQSMGISEMFILKSPIIADAGQADRTADYWYSISSSNEGIWNGTWGLIRNYKNLRFDLGILPSNPLPFLGPLNGNDFADGCPKAAPIRAYNVSVVRAADVLPTIVAGAIDPIVSPLGKTLIYNSRPDVVCLPAGPNILPDVVNLFLPPCAIGPDAEQGPLHDPTALLFVDTATVVRNSLGKPVGLTAGTPIEPIVLRARAGECVNVTLKNELTLDAQGRVPDLPGWNTLAGVVNLEDALGKPAAATFNNNRVRPSTEVGLHTQLLEYDITKSDGMNVGINDVQTIKPGQTRTYKYYAGDIRVKDQIFGILGRFVATPVEFGGVGLMSSDPIKHNQKGLMGSLVVEPANATWTTDVTTRAQANVSVPNTPGYREFVTVYQTAINERFASNVPVPALAAEGLGLGEDTEDGGQKGVNYKIEPLWFRAGSDPRTFLPDFRFIQTANMYSNNQLTPPQDPQTPIFTAKAGTPVRFHLVQPGGQGRNFTIAVHGHDWERMPYNADPAIDGPTIITDNPFSQRVGSQEGLGAFTHWTLVPRNGAGGLFKVSGDYLIRPQDAWHNVDGIFNIFRVTP